MSCTFFGLFTIVYFPAQLSELGCLWASSQSPAAPLVPAPVPQASPKQISWSSRALWLRAHTAHFIYFINVAS